MAVGTKQKFIFRALFDECIPFKSASTDLASIADGNEQAVDVAVEGAELGDFVLIAPGVDVTDLAVVASVTAADVVTIVVGNWTGGAINLGAQVFTGVVLKPGDVFAQL